MGIIRVLLFPIQYFYYAIVWGRNFFYDKGLIGVKKVNCKVVSVGNLSLGGTGKTPFVIYLAKHLINNGKRVVVLMRGYKGEKSSRKPFIVSDGEKIYGSVKQCGDEAILVAKSARVAVVIGKKRVESAKLAINKFSPEYILLDDGFQHRRLYRDVDIVIIAAEDGRHLFPVGRLREPLYSLKRASLIYSSKGELKDLKYDILKIAGKVPVEKLKLYISGWRVNEHFKSPESIRGKRVIIMAGIASIDFFINQVKELGAIVIKVFKYSDHYFYKISDMESIKRGVQEFEANAIVTTEKDEVKLRTLNVWIPDLWVSILGIEVNEITLNKFLCN